MFGIGDFKKTSQIGFITLVNAQHVGGHNIPKDVL